MAKFGFVGGGQMAQALASGACAANVVTASELAFAEPGSSQQKSLRDKFPEAIVVDSASEMLVDCSTVLLAVKPHILRAIAPEIAKMISDKQLVVSIAAGVSLAELKEILGAKRIIRVMPNTPCQIGVGASTISAGSDADEQDLQTVVNLMKSVGIVEVVPNDDLMHAATSLAGSGPAYIYAIIEALSDGGVLKGLPRDVATRLAAQTVRGAAEMVLQTNQHPGALKDQVTSPGGTTIAGLRELEAAGLRSALIEAVAAGTERSEELS